MEGKTYIEICITMLQYKDRSIISKKAREHRIKSLIPNKELDNNSKTNKAQYIKTKRK